MVIEKDSNVATALKFLCSIYLNAVFFKLDMARQRLKKIKMSATHGSFGFYVILDVLKLNVADIYSTEKNLCYEFMRGRK